MSLKVREVRIGRPKSKEKAEAILDAAGELFLTQGFQATSMDAVAQRAEVSKRTVYSHFSNKEELFKACIRNKVAGYGFNETADVSGGDLRSGLLAVTRQYIHLLFDPEVIAMHRVVMGEATSHPRIAALFFESGPAKTKATVSRFLSEQVKNGRLKIDEDLMSYATVQLLNTAVGMYHLELMMGLRKEISEDELRVHLERTVDDFIRLYGFLAG